MNGDLGTTLWTTAEAARAAGVQPATIRQWASRGYLTRANLDQPDQPPRYWALDVARAERRTRDRARRHYVIVPAA